MKQTLCILLLVFISCKPQESPKSKSLNQTGLFIPGIVLKSDLSYTPNNSLWTLNGKKFSGYAISFHPNKSLKEQLRFQNGRKQNQSRRWFPNGDIEAISNYNRGKLQGNKKNWIPDSIHTLVSHLQYNSGKLHGPQKKWYSTGELFKDLNFNMGKEEGQQKAYRKNGALFANYEAKEGRIFGLKKAALCFGLEDEEIQTSGKDF